MMRLTEVVVDWAFNQIDPENIIDNKDVLPHFKYQSHNLTATGLTVVVGDYVDDEIRNLGSNPFAVNDIVYDSRGRFIGRIKTISGSGPYTIEFWETAYQTNGLLHYAGQLFRVPVTEHFNERSEIKGHGESDTFILWNKPIHMLKSAVMQNTATSSTGDYGDNASEFYAEHNSSLLGGTMTPSDRNPNIWLPFSVTVTGANNEPAVSHGVEDTVSHLSHPSHLFEKLSATKVTDDGTIVDADKYYNKLLPIFLDRFNIENGGGSLADIGMVGRHVTATSIRLVNLGATTEIGVFGLALQDNFAKHTNSKQNTTHSYDNTADGVIMGFKLQLTISSSADGWENDRYTAGANRIYTYRIDASGDRAWLDLMDLTGCYLVSNNAKKYTENGSPVSTVLLGIDSSVPYTVAQVISHEIDTNNVATVNKHILTLDTALPSSGTYRVMQPNHTCFHSFGPKTIIPNFTTSAYTKKPREDSMYKDIKNYNLHNKQGDYLIPNNNEGVQSMYVIVDPDSQTSSSHLVLRDASASTLLDGLDHTMCVSDGDTTFKTAMSIVPNTNSIDNAIKFDKMKTIKGIASISETLNITVGSKLDTSIKRLSIGAVVSICNEAEDSINELLEENDIDFDLTTSDYPLFLAPNYQGVDLFSALNFLLQKKNKQITNEDGVFTIKDDNDSAYHSGIVISEDSDYQIYEYEKIKSTFDFYNEIIVYGNSHKGTKKDLKSIQKRGRKTLEVHDNKLYSQEEVDKHAYNTLILHNKLNTSRFKVKIGHQNISQIKTGDIVGFELKRENLPLNHYMVLEIRHELTGNIVLTLGKYGKNLEDRFAELLIDSKEIKSKIRQDEFGNNAISYDFLDRVSIKPLKLIIRTRNASGGASLGFGTALNTNTSTLGYTGGVGVIVTTLKEVEF